MLQQIRSFLVVAEEGSLRRAADRLRMSQPALSRQMQALEHELGGSLLDRMSTGVGLTRSGYALASRAMMSICPESTDAW
jgi:DNA-binding transcriptional LysR family regulator